MMMTGTEFKIVQFSGGGAMITDMLGGHSHATISTGSVVIPHMRAGALRVLGVGGKRRSPLLPDVPTIAQAAYPGYEATGWWGMLAPAGHRCRLSKS